MNIKNNIVYAISTNTNSIPQLVQSNTTNAIYQLVLFKAYTIYL